MPVPMAAGVAAAPPTDEVPRHFLFVIDPACAQGTYLTDLGRAVSDKPSVDAAILAAVRAPLPLLPWSLAAGWAARSQINHWVESHATDAVFVHVRGVALLSQPSMRQTPTVLAVEATPWNRAAVRGSRGARWIGPLRKGGSARITGRIFRSAAAIVTWSHWAADSLISDYGVHPQRVRVIRPGVDLGRFHPAKLRRPGMPVRVLFVGENFVHQGGPDVMAALSRLGPACELDIVTDSEVGPFQAGLSCRIHRGVTAGSQRLIELYEGADIYVWSSEDESFPESIPQALACGLPVVAVAVGAIPELVGDGINGFLVPARHPTQLRRALEALVASTELRMAMGERSLELARREHDSKANTTLVLQLLVEVASDNAATTLAQ